MVLRQTLLLSLIICLLAIKSEAQDTILVDQVVLKDKRLATTLREASRPVAVLHRSEVLNAPAQSFEELLSYHSGLDVQQKGPHGIQADLVIRGGTFEQSLILLNGIRMTDIQTGHHNFNLPLMPMAIERIEIVKGPAARRYGQNAYTGAVQLITRTPKKDELLVQASYGDFGVLNIGGMLGLAGERTSHMAQVNYASSDGYRYNTDYRKANLWYQSETKTNFGRMRLQGGYTKKDFGAHGFYANPDFRDQYEEVETSLVSGEADIIGSRWRMTPRVYWRRNQDMYLFVRSDPSVLRNLHISNVVGLETNATIDDGIGGTGVGVDVRREFLSSNNLGDRDRTVASCFVEKNIDLLGDRLRLTPGFTWSSFSDFGAFFYPGIDAAYTLRPGLSLFANVGQTYRVPSFTDLYYMDPGNLGNPDLAPEEALAYEAGIRSIAAAHSLTLSVFRRQTDNLIDWTRDDDAAPWQPFNISELNTTGIEIQYDYRFTHTPLDRLSVGYTYIDNDLVGNSAPFSRYALNNLRHQLCLSISHHIIKDRLSHHIVYRYSDRITLDDYHLVDSRFAYSLEHWELFATINNVFDTDYRESNLVPMPGRWFRMGVTLDIGI